MGRYGEIHVHVLRTSCCCRSAARWLIREIWGDMGRYMSMCCAPAAAAGARRGGSSGRYGEIWGDICPCAAHQLLLQERGAVAHQGDMGRYGEIYVHVLRTSCCC